MALHRSPALCHAVGLGARTVRFSMMHASRGRLRRERFPGRRYRRSGYQTRGFMIAPPCRSSRRAYIRADAAPGAEVGDRRVLFGERDCGTTERPADAAAGAPLRVDRVGFAFDPLLRAVMTQGCFAMMTRTPLRSLPAEGVGGGAGRKGRRSRPRRRRWAGEIASSDMGVLSSPVAVMPVLGFGW